MVLILGECKEYISEVSTTYFTQVSEVDRIQDVKWSLMHHWREQLCANYYFKVVLYIEFQPLQGKM